MLKLMLSKRAEKFLRSLPPKQFRQVTLSLLDLLTNSHPHDSAPLHGARRGEHRVDVGEYRLIYRLENDVVRALVIGKRNDDAVYREWERISERG